MTDINELTTYGINFLATAKDDGQQVLLVGIKEAYRGKQQYQKALHREFAKNHDIDHPNILKYIAEKEDESTGPCIEMEWEDSRTLSDYVQEGHTEDEKKNILEQIANGVGFLHQNNIVHGALDPSIIFITKKTDQVKILNFRQRYADGLNQPSASLKYIAPEAKDGTVALDARADIFSLGEILKTLNISPDYQQIVETACSFGRSDRYMSVDDFLSAFSHRRRTHSTVSESGEESGMHPTARTIYILVAVIAVLVVIAAVWVFKQQNKNDEPQVAATEQVDSLNQAEQQEVEKAAPTSDSVPQESQQLADQQQADQQQGDMAFLNDLVPQMKIDLDKIYANTADQQAIGRKVGSYYKGLRRVLVKKGLNDQQLQAFDKAFADYNNQKKAQ